MERAVLFEAEVVSYYSVETDKVSVACGFSARKR